MTSTNDPYSSDAAHVHDDVDWSALELTRFEQSEAARDREPVHLERDPTEADSGPLGRADTVAAEVSALARHGDPSVSKETQRRTGLERQVRDRRSVRWVPATELMRQSTAKLAGQSMRLQTRTHRAARDAAVKAVIRGGVAASQRVRRLGQARPLRTFSVGSAARDAAGR
jgi:hypothetical protein